MLFEHALTIPASTSVLEPTEALVKLTAGILVQVDVVIPWGVGALAGIRMLYENWQILPITPGQWLTGNDQRLTFPENYQIKSDPFYVKIQGYNSDDTYEHTITLMLTIMRYTLNERAQSFVAALMGG